MPKVVFIAGPYRGKDIFETLTNIRKAEEYAIKYWRKGYAVFCPHKNTALLDGACEDDVWLNGGIEFLRRSDFVVVIPGHETSKGTQAEILEAKDLGLPLVYEE